MCQLVDLARRNSAPTAPSLRAAAAIAVCIDQRAACSKVVELCKAEFPRPVVLARAFDREHSVELLKHGADYQIRETFESALVFGRHALERLGFSPEQAAETYEEVRRRDTERFDLDLAGGVNEGARLLISTMPKPQPFTTPQRAGRALNEETAEVRQGDLEGAAEG